jgi:hypothetical protein
MIAQKKYLNLTALLVALITGVMFLPGLTHAAVIVEGEVRFGEVEVGIQKSVTLNISSSALRTYISKLELDNNCGFSISPEVSVPKVLPVSIAINYVPFFPGLCNSTLSIDTNDGNTKVILSGTGVVTQKDDITIEGILDFFDQCVADGTLEGYVPDKSAKKKLADKTPKGNGSDNLAENRLNALRNMIETAGNLIDSGKTDEACGQLKAAYKKMDNPDPPENSTDFVEVEGVAASDLSTMVQALMDGLDCK